MLSGLAYVCGCTPTEPQPKYTNYSESTKSTDGPSATESPNTLFAVLSKQA